MCKHLKCCTATDYGTLCPKYLKIKLNTEYY